MTVDTPTVAPALSTVNDDAFGAPPLQPNLVRSHAHLSDSDFRSIFDIDSTITSLRERKYKSVALQFPDELLADSERVYSLLKRGIDHDPADGQPEVKLYVLADTSYASCCVDEIAAEHVGADVVVHYGRSCLSPTTRLPVIYVFTANQIDLEVAVKGFENIFPGKKTKILLMADVTYDKHTGPLHARLKENGYENVFCSEVIHSPNALLPNRTLPPEVIDEIAMKEWSLFHIAEPLPSLHLILASRVNSLYYFDVETNKVNTAIASPLLRRRYAVLSHAKTAGIIGILVNTLNVQHYLPMISCIKRQIHDAGKKSYLVVAGKVNVEKVANFAEIEAWVGVGCWEQGVVGGTDSRGWYRPIITPWELSITLGRQGWTGRWISDIGEVLRINEDSTIPESSVLKDETSEHEEDLPPEFDLRTGRYVSTSRPLGARGSLRGGEMVEEGKVREAGMVPKQLTLTGRQKELRLAGGVVSPAAQFVREQRSWRGLGSDFSEEGPGVEDEENRFRVKEGRRGIARSYYADDGNRY